MRLQKLAEENDLKLAQEMMGLGSSGGGGGVIDNMNPSTKDEFEELSEAITDKLSNFESSEHYQDFVENLVKNLCPSLSAQTLKKCETHVEAFHSAKLKEERAATSKSKQVYMAYKLRLNMKLKFIYQRSKLLSTIYSL